MTVREQETLLRHEFRSGHERFERFHRHFFGFHGHEFHGEHFHGAGFYPYYGCPYGVYAPACNGRPGY